MKAHNARHAVKGFALIATISVLLLLTLVAVAFLSLSALTLKTSRFEWAQEEARANARLGLMIAIGELQRDLGPDQRIAVSASLLDSNPDTIRIEGVANPNWTGVISSVFEGNRSGSPYSRNMDQGGMQDARGGTRFRARDFVNNYFVSGNEGGKERMRGIRQYQDARTENLRAGEEAVEIVSRGSAKNPEDFVTVKKMVAEAEQRTPDGQSEYRPKGAYAYWVSSNNQKAHIGRPDAHRNTQISNTTGAGIWRMLHPMDAEPFVMEGIEVGQQNRDTRILTPKSFTLVSDRNKQGVLTNFHAMTGLASSVICSVRDGGLKKNLSAYLHGSDAGGPPTIKNLKNSQKPAYIGIAPEDFLIGPPNESYAALRDEDFNDTQYQDIAPTFELLWNWAQLSEEFRFGESSTGIREQKVWTGAPFRNGGANIYDGENLRPADPRNLTDIKITPVIVEAATYYNLATYPTGSGSTQQNVLRLCIYPRIGLWNPYNVEMRLDKPMMLQLFLNGKKTVEFDKDSNFTREIYFGGRRNTFDGQYGGQVYFKLPQVTIPPGETFIFSMGGAPRELDIRNFGANLLQAQEPPSSASYLYKDYVQQNISGTRASFARDSDDKDSEFMPKAPLEFRERPLDFAQHGADNYMFMLKYLKNNPNEPNINSFRSEPTLVYASVSLQAGGGDEYPLQWDTQTTAKVIPLTGAGDHIDEGIAPHPFTRDGFRVRWLNETLSNKSPNNELFLQEAPLGNWNLRASYITRNPFDNVTNRTPYFHGIYNRDNPSDDLSWDALAPVARDGFQTGFPFGQANFGVESVVAFEVPTREVGIPSLAYLRHLQLSEYVWHPSYAIGSSIADPRVPSTGTVPVDVPGGDHGWSAQGLGTAYWARLFNDLVFYLSEDNHLIYDMSFEVNHNLWSDFFLTGATPNQAANFAQDPVNRPLKNGNLRLWDRNGDPTEDLTDFFRAAGRLMIEGGFDVHSTQKEAWKAFLSTTRDTGYGSPNRTPFPRTLFPKGQENTRAEYSTKVFTGFRSLSDEEIDSFAEAIVREVKIRAPFFGMSDFVNRRLAEDETGRNGVLEAALEKSLPNRGQNGRFPIIRQELPEQGQLIAQGSPQQSDLTRLDQKLKPASTGYGTPGYITQGDVLKVIGSGLVARSDTFTIRSYGEAVDVNGEITARAWCEATVQRTPAPIIPDEVSGLNPKEATGNQIDFGRRFEIVSFRWLHADEV